VPSQRINDPGDDAKKRQQAFLAPLPGRHRLKDLLMFWILSMISHQYYLVVFSYCEDRAVFD
jgi:hypothetical protein